MESYTNVTTPKKLSFNIAVLVCSIVNLMIGLFVTVAGNLWINYNEYFRTLKASTAVFTGTYRRFICVFMLIYFAQIVMAVITNIICAQKSSTNYDKDKPHKKSIINIVISTIPFVIIGVVLFSLQFVISF